MRLILVRHGQTDCNVLDIWHGWDDCGLTRTGLAQAESASSRLAFERLDAIYSSDSPRAVQTAKVIGQPHGLKPRPERAFRERFAGEFEGLSVAEVERRHPTVWDERDSDYWAWSPPGGESFYAVLARTLDGVKRIQALHPHGTVVLVGHMGTVRTLISHFAQVPIEKTYEMPFPSVGVSIFVLDGEAVRAESLNDDAHVQTPPS